MRHLLVVFACFPCVLPFKANAALPIIGEMDVREHIAQALHKRGLKTGLNEGTDLLIGIGAAIAEVGPIAIDRSVFKVVSDLHKVAYMNAMRDSLKRTRIKYSAESASRVVSGEGVGMMEFSELSKALAQGYFSQGEVLHVKEAWNGEAYAVAVAVGWSREGGKRNAVALDMPDLLQVDEIFCQKWLQSVDLGTMSGFRCVKHDSGGQYIFGFGMVDAKDLSGRKLVSAMRLSKIDAIQSVAFALNSEVVMTEILKKGLTGKSEGKSHVWDAFTSTVQRKCIQQIPPVEVVYDGVVKHTLIGRDVYMTVCAVNVR